MGSYPQSRVTDDKILSQLNSLSLSWLSYGYYSGDGSLGSMKKSDYMQYADVMLNDLKYRAVKFSNYRPGMTISSSSTGNSYQDNNGYYIDTVYWFIYEPIKWQVLDYSSGLVISNMLIDSQAYSNTIYSGNYNDSDNINYACDYYTSSIREWLNNDFYNTAFSTSDKYNIKTTTLNNNARSSKYNSKESEDNIFLLSWDESQNSSYGFSSNGARSTTGTDYAKCQGLKNKYWTLRTAADSSTLHTGVHDGGNVTFGCSQDNVYNTYNGIRPAMQIYIDGNSNVNLCSIKSGTSQFTVYNADEIASYDIANKVIGAEANLKLNGVTAEIGSESKSFDKEFWYTTNNIRGKQITFSKSGYRDYNIPTYVTNDECYLNKQTHNIYMTKDRKDEKSYVSSVFVQQLTEDNKPKSAYKEVQTESVSILEEINYNVIISANTKSANSSTYYLAQDNAHKISNKTGVFLEQELYSHFDFNSTIYAYVVCDGVTSDTVALKLKKEKIDDGLKSILSSSTINVFGADSTKFTLSDDVPFLGGSSVSTDFIKCPVGIEVEGNRVRISLGFDLWEKETDKNGNWKDTEWKGFKDVCKGLNEATKNTEKSKKEFDKFLKKKGYKKGKESGKTFSTDFFGYIEGSIVNGRLVITEISGTVAAEFAYKLKAQFGPAGIPAFYAYVEAGAEASAETSVALALPDYSMPIQFDVTIGITPKVTGGAGIGLEGVVSGGVYAKATMPINYAFAKKNLKLGFTGEVGVEGHFIIANAKIPVFNGEVNLINHTFGTSKKAKANVLNRNNSLEYAIGEAQAEVSVLSRDYVDNQKWVGTKSVSARKAKVISVNGINTLTLEQSVNESPQPQLVTNGNQLMLIWVDDDVNRDTYNRYKLVYSIYNNGSWSEPKAVDDCGTNDYQPTVIANGNDIYIAYQNFKTSLTGVDDSTVKTLLENSEIKIAKYNADVDAFEDVKTITSNDTYDYSPYLTIENGETIVYWANCSSTNYSAGSGSVMKSDMSGNVSTVYTNLNYIHEICAVDNDVYYTMDTNVSNETVFDLNLYKNGESITSNDGSDPNSIPISLEVGTINDNQTVFYTTDDNIYYIDKGNLSYVIESGSNIGGSLEIINDGNETTAIWCQATEYGTEFYTSSYDGEKWSAPVQIGEYNSLLSELSVVNYNGILFGVYNKTQRILEDDTYVNGLSDLCLFQTQGITDISVSIGTFNESVLELNKESSFTVFVENIGTNDINSVDFKITDTNGYEKNITKAVSIPSGESELIELPYVPCEFASGKMQVIAVVDGDTNSDNNTDEISIGNADLYISDLTLDQIGTQNVVSGVITNVGTVSAENVVVAISSNGEVFNETETIDLTPNESATINFEISSKILTFDSESNACDLVLTASSDTSEMVLGNNVSSLAIENHIHLFSEWIVLEEASCTARGSKTRNCLSCNLVEKEEIEMIPHNYDEGIVDKKPTCAKTGTLHKTCTVCGDTKTETISKTSHIYEAQLTEPTCLDQGYTTYTCINCSYSYKANYTNAKGHNYVDGKCEWCGKTEVVIHLNENIVFNIEKSNSIELAQFTPEESGTYYFYSDAVGDTYGYLYDSNMNQLVSDDDSGNERNFLIEYSFEAGKTYYLGAKFYSTKLGELNIGLRDSYTDGHNLEFVQTVEPTCTTDGYDEYYCNNCRQTIQKNIVNAFGHSYIEEVVEPTCTLQGYTEYTCFVCGDSYRDDYIAANGHSYDENWVCEVCGDDKNLYLNVEKTAFIDTNSIIEGDFFIFTPVKSGTYEFESIGTSDTYGYLCDSDMNQLASDNDGGSENNFLIKYNCEAGKTYILLCMYNGNGIKGPFNVIARCAHTYVNGICEVCGDDRNIYLDIEKAAVIDSNNQYAYFEFTPAETGTYTFSSISEDDTYGYIYDENMNELASDDGSGDDGNFSVKYKLQANTKYIFGCRYYSTGNAGEFNVVVTKNIEIRYTPINPIEIIENTNGQWDKDNNDEDFYRYYTPWFMQGDVFTIIDKDGNSVKYTFISDDSGFDYFISEDGSTINPDDINLYSNQYSNPWTIDGENYLTIEYMGVDTQVPVSVVANQVASISFTPAKPIEYIENTNGYWDTDDNGEEFYHYDDGEYLWFLFLQDGAVITVTDKDGSVVDYVFDVEGWKFISKDGDVIYTNSVHYNTHQSDKPWKSDSDNYFTVEYLGATTQVPVTIVENPVSSITYTSINPIEIFENTHGYLNESWDYDEDGNEHYEEYWCYNTPWFNNGDVLTVTDKKGDSIDYIFNDEYNNFVSEDGNVIDADSVDCTSEQYLNHWTIGGENYFIVEYMGAEIQVPVTIVENPVASISFTPIEPYEIIENTHGYWDEYWYEDEEGNEQHGEYWCYNTPWFNNGDVLTVTDKNGVSVDYIFNDNECSKFVSEDGNVIDADSVDRTSEQYSNYWSVGGENCFIIKYMGATANVPVSIVRCDHQYRVEIYEPSCVSDGYTHYYCEICGTSYNADYVEATGIHTYVNGFCKYCHAKDNDYTLPTISLGETKTVNIKNEGDYYYFSFTPEADGNYIFSSNGDADTYGYLYDSDMNELYLNDDGGNGSNFSIRYDFEAGKTYVFGCRYYSSEDTGSFDVSLIENRVASIAYTPINQIEIIENLHGYWDEYWYDDEDGNEQYEEYWNYEIPSYQNGDILTVIDKDGNSVDYIFNDNKYSFVSENGDVIYGNSLNHSSDQTSNHWTISGENYFTIEYLDAEVHVPVTIIENPVESIEYAPVNGFVNAEGITYASGDGDSYHINEGYVKNGDKLTINYKNAGIKEYFAVFDDAGFYEFVTADGEKLNEDDAEFYLRTNDWDEPTSVIVHCYGKSVELPISEQITIENIEFAPVHPVTIIESHGYEDNRHTWTDDAGNVIYSTFVYWREDENGETTIESEIFNTGDVINVTFSNGQTASYTYYANRSYEFGYCFIGDDKSVLYVGDIRHNQYEQPWTIESDNNWFKINFSNTSTDEIPVTIVKNVDASALQAAIEKFSEFNSADYSEASYNNLKNIVDNHKSLLDTAQSQEDVDRAVIEILEAIYDLEPYFNFTVSAENGSYEVACNGSTSSDNKYSLLFGTEITLSATANEGYEFIGWYDVTNNLYFSKESTYTFKITSNTNLKAVCAKKQSATLTFTTYSNWVQSTVTKTVDEWNSISSIDDLLPEVPYKYGYSNGRWVYDNDEVLAKLRAGESVFLIPEYDEDDTSVPTPREPVDGVPALDLYYKLNADKNVGSFVMAAGIPDDCRIESVGIAFYYKKANEFDPTKFELLNNNKMLVGRFNTDELEDIYIVNMNKFTSAYNWAARGVVTYYDAEGNLKTAYSNQVNIVNREQV